MHFKRLAALLTRDATAPVKATVALPGSRLFHGHVTATAAQVITSVVRRTSPITDATSSSKRLKDWIEDTEVGGLLQVDKVTALRFVHLFTRSLQLQQHGSHRSVTFDRLHAAGSLVLDLETIPDDPEARQSRPTGFRRAGTGVAVTLAGDCHAVQ